ncbi:MAG: phosphoribosylamine--glycine ligase [Flavobacteriales bacterium]
MKILIIGNGGREHAIGKKILKDNPSVQLYFATGNGGTAQIGTNISANTVTELVQFAETESINLTMVGSEALLVEGIVDQFQAKGLKIFGPNQKAAQLEGSKTFAKEFMVKHGIKTAAYKTFTGYYAAKDYLAECVYPTVIKADGLAEGKGVVICHDQETAEKTLKEIMKDKIFGDSGNTVVIEEFLDGKEASILSYFNGKEIISFISAKDHKKIGEGETGLNTGGMGVVAPNPYVTDEVNQAFMDDILNPTLKGLLKEELIFSGVIFFGLMITDKGVYLLEYNLRMGDPETQAILPLMKSNLLEITEKALSQESFLVQWKKQYSCCVVMVSGGYPMNYDKGFEILGLENVDTDYYIAGSKLLNNKQITSGGRVLNVVGYGNTLEEAREVAYKNVKKIRFDFKYYREDIGL